MGSVRWPLQAFDTAPRDSLFAVLRHYGLQNHFMNIITRLYKNEQIKVMIGSVDSEIESSIGVREGSCEGPVLFLFIIQVALETMQRPVPKPEFALVRTELPWVNVQNGNEEQSSTSMAVHCTLMTRPSQVVPRSQATNIYAQFAKQAT
jgi:hypothetical protein